MTAARYELRVRGLVADEVVQQFGDVSVTVTGVSTVLSGSVADQSALLGLLARVRALGLDLIEVRRVYAPPDLGSPGGSGGSRSPRHVSSAGGEAAAAPLSHGGPDDGRPWRRPWPETSGGVAMSDELAEMGPVDYVVVEFPGNRMTGEAFPILVDLVDRGIIRILDLLFVRKELDGSVSGLAIADLDGDGELDLAVFEGASSGLLDQDDVEAAGQVLEPGSSAGILVYENSWAGPFAAALRRGGAQLVASGSIPVQDLLASLESAETVV